MKPSIVKGTRDFGTVEMSKRNYIFNTIREVYNLYGFQQIETPAMENMSTLMGKYGEEGDRLLFRIQNSGAKADLPAEKGLHYDLTVPFARYVVMHKEELTMPFRRYQIQPVWRADRPQKGRYREFYQCDADVIGSDSLLNEVELIQIIDTVFTRFNVRVSIHVNNRKLLSAIAEILGAEDKIVEITVAIDKLHKIGIQGVNAELLENGLTPEQVEKLQPIMFLSGSNEDKLDKIAELVSGCEIGEKGVSELRFILNTLKNCGLKNVVELDLTLARGLSYYTGAIFEVEALDCPIGSITGGGRYDNLTGIFGLPNMSGVGISFGAERIFDVLNQLELYPTTALTNTQVLFINFGERETEYCIPLAKTLRDAGISSEIYPDAVKMKKQMSYANAKQIAYVALAGESEIAENKITVKNMLTGEQKLVGVEELVDCIR